MTVGLYWCKELLRCKSFLWQKHYQYNETIHTMFFYNGYLTDKSELFETNIPVFYNIKSVYGEIKSGDYD